MNNKPMETKNYIKPKKNKNPMTMLVIGFVIGAALSTGSFWAGTLYAVGTANRNTPGVAQTTVQTTGETLSPTLSISYG